MLMTPQKSCNVLSIMVSIEASFADGIRFVFYLSAPASALRRVGNAGIYLKLGRDLKCLDRRIEKKQGAGSRWYR